MKSTLKKLLTLTVGLGVIGTANYSFAANGDDVNNVAATTTKEPENKLVKLSSLEQSYRKAERNIKILNTRIITYSNALKKIKKEEDKDKVTAQIKKDREMLKNYAIAMNIVFGLGNQRQYVYDPVKSTVYLRVGTVEETFARTINLRDAYKKFVLEQKKLKEDATKTAEELKTIENNIKIGTKRYQNIAASLQIIFNVAPQRNYLYNPKNSSLYLKITETELTKLKTDIKALQEKREAAKNKATETKED